MVGKKVEKVVKLEIGGGKGNGGPGVGGGLGEGGVKIMGLCKELNGGREEEGGLMIGVEMSVYEEG